MSLSKINNYANDDSDILELQLTADALFNNSFSLTEMDSSTVPAIAIGSKVEVGGAYYQAEAEEAISTTDPVTAGVVADGTVYICIVPAVDGLTCTAAFTATAPTWSDIKQGWYGTGGQAGYKYISECIKATASYLNKRDLKKIKQPIICSLSVGANTYGAVSNQLVNFSDTIYDSHGIYDTADDKLTFPHGGLYEINFVFTHEWSTAAAREIFIGLAINLNGSQIASSYAHTYAGNVQNDSCTLSMIYRIEATQYLEFKLYRSGASIPAGIVGDSFVSIKELI